MHCVASNRILFKPEVKLSVDISLPSINYVGGDSYRMVQILTNILSNAAKFTKEVLTYGDGGGGGWEEGG